MLRGAGRGIVAKEGGEVERVEGEDEEEVGGVGVGSQEGDYGGVWCGGGEDAGFAFGVVWGVCLGGSGEFEGEGLVGWGGLVGFVDCGEEARGVVGAVGEGADGLGGLGGR